MHVGADFLLASVGGGPSASSVFVVVAKLRKLITDPVLDTAISFVVPFGDLHRRRGDPRARASSPSSSPACCSGHKAPDHPDRAVADRRADELAHHRLRPREHGLPADRPAGRAGSSTTSTTATLSRRADRAVCAADAGRRASCCAWRGCSPRATCWSGPGADPVTGQRPPWTFTFILGWAGMRGVVTLAAAFVIPEDTPHREVLLLIAFTVVAGTLFIQGLSLPLLARRLQRAVARPGGGRAGPRGPAPAGVQGRLQGARRSSSTTTRTASWSWSSSASTSATSPPGSGSARSADAGDAQRALRRVRLAMIEAERARVLEIRDAGQVASDVVSEVLAMLDVEESMLDSRAGQHARAETEYSRLRRTGASCDHLESRPGRGGRAGTGTGLPAVRRRRLHVGLAAAAAWTAATSAAATPRVSGTRPGTSARPRTRSCSRRSRWRTGAGASCTT